MKGFVNVTTYYKEGAGRSGPRVPIKDLAVSGPYVSFTRGNETAHYIRIIFSNNFAVKCRMRMGDRADLFLNLDNGTPKGLIKPNKNGRYVLISKNPNSKKDLFYEGRLEFSFTAPLKLSRAYREKVKSRECHNVQITDEGILFTFPGTN